MMQSHHGLATTIIGVRLDVRRTSVEEKMNGNETTESTTPTPKVKNIPSPNSTGTNGHEPPLIEKDRFVEEPQSAGIGSYILAAFLGAVIAEFLTFSIYYCVKRRRKSSRKQSGSDPSDVRIALSTGLNDDENKPINSKNSNQNNGNGLKKNDFFDVKPIYAETSEHIKIVRKSRRSAEMIFNDTSLTDDDEMAFMLKANKQQENITSTDRVPLVEPATPDFPRPPPAHIIGNYETSETLPLPCSQRNDDILPPKLPPKQGSHNLFPVQGEPALITPLFDANTNNNNAKAQDRPSALNSLLFPPPPPNSDREEDKSEDNSLISTPRSLTPTFKPPPPPKAKVGIVKHETFSGPLDRKKKPPVPRKSAAVVVRSASMRPPVRSRPSGFERTFARDDQILKAKKTNREENAVVNLPLNQQGRRPHSSNKARSVIPVTPPTVPR